jgi:hypothetical protein
MAPVPASVAFQAVLADLGRGEARTHKYIIQRLQNRNFV